jgi:P4 family phage/plasmid primase-like protien
MNDRDDKAEKTNIESDKDHQEADAIPAIAPDSKEPDDEWVHLLPCARKMMQVQALAGEDRSIAVYTLARHFNADNVPKNFTLSTILSWNKKNSQPLNESDIVSTIEDAYKGRGKKDDKYLGCDNEVIRQFCDDDCPISVKRAKGFAGKYFVGHRFSPKKLADELVGEHHFIYVGSKLHAYQDGFYAQNGEAFARRKCREKLHYEANIAWVSEVISHITDMTFVEPDKLNTFVNLINLENGMLDWRSGNLVKHSPHYLSTLRIPVAFNPEAKCPAIDRFLQSSLPADCLALIEEWLGWVLLPSTAFQKALVLLGVGSNGKSVFLNLLEHYVGSQNISKVPLQELDGNRFKRYLLWGVLVNLFGDLDTTDLQSSSYFKTIVSGDQIDAERKFCDAFSFRPFCRLVYSTNNFPKSPDKGFAFYRRLVMVTFPNQFLGKDADKSLIDRLIQPEELSGLLNRALEGLRRLHDNGGFTESATANETLAEYKRWNDPVDSFVQDRCEFGDPVAYRVERQSFFNEYIRYCGEEGFGRESNQVFYKRIRSYPGVGQVEGNDGRYILTGIKIKSKVK